MNNRIINVKSSKIPIKGITPAFYLENPKFPHNVSMVVRLASCYGIGQVWYSGDRVTDEIRRTKRMPREERMKGYREVEIINHDRVFDYFEDVTPVAVEVRNNAEPLYDFEHPENPLYIFGAEDGSISKSILHRCHRFVVIPTRHCLNLATAAATLLWDRQYKSYLNGKDVYETPGNFEHRGYEEPDISLFAAAN